MNGKIKTKFAALFAVALMITVCVVPMVGGSEDVEAATTTETVTISGNVYAADGVTGIVGAKVYVDADGDNALEDGEINVLTTAGGAFSLEIDITAPVNIILNVVTVAFTDGTTNPALNLTMPTITLNNVDGDEAGLKFVAGKVWITGQLMKNDGVSPVYIENATITVTGETITPAVTTDKDGKYKFLATVDNTLSLSTSVGATTPMVFSAESFVVSPSTSTQNLKATGYIMDAIVSVPTGTFVSTSTGVAATLGDLVFGTDGSNYHVYALINYALVGSGTGYSSYVAKFSYNIAGILDSTEVQLFPEYAANVIPTKVNVSISAVSSGTVISGNVVVGTAYDGVNVNLGGTTPGATVLLHYKKAATETSWTSGQTITPFYAYNKYFVGPYYLDVISSVMTPVASYKIEATAATALTGYKYSPITTTGNIYSNNHVKISGNVGTDAGVGINVTSTSKVTTMKEWKTQANGAYSFYTVKGNSVTVVPSGTNMTFNPSSVSYSKVNVDTVLQTIAVTKLTEYVGKVLFNGIAIGATELGGTSGLQYTVNASAASPSFSAVTWVEEEGKEPYYSFKTSVSDLSEIRVTSDSTYDEVIVKGTSFVAVVDSVGKMTDITIKETEQTVTVKDANNLGLPGVDVEFVLVDSADLGNHKVTVEKSLGSVTSDKNGQVKLKFALPRTGSEFTAYMIPSSTSEFGTYKLDAGVYAASITAVGQNTLYGYYTNDASEISGLEMSYVVKLGTEIKEVGSATIVGNKYYIVSATAPAGTPAVNPVVSVSANGYKVNTAGEEGLTSIGVYKGQKDIVLTPVVKQFAVSNGTVDEFKGHVTVSVDGGNVAAGTVITLSAEKVCYKVLVDKNQYEYTDAAVEYTFAGWYVNGKLLTTDLDAAYTVDGNAVIVAQYNESIEVVGEPKVAEEAGLDTNVLILGIVVVIIALIAVVYAVISKKE